MWKCKTCGCQNPDTCTACRMCKAAAPNNTTPGYTAPNYNGQSSSTHESAQKFCGRCGRQLAYGQSTCRYCVGTPDRGTPLPTTKSKNNVAVIVAAAIVCVAAALLLPRLLNGNHQTQYAQEPQTVQEPQTEQNPPANLPEQEEAQEVQSLTSLCDTILADEYLRFIGSPLYILEHDLGKVTKVLFDINGTNRFLFEQSQGHRFDFGDMVIPTEFWYTWTSEEFYREYQSREPDGDGMFRDGDNCKAVEINVAEVYREWINQPTVFTPSMIEQSGDLDPSNPEEFLSWVENLEQGGTSNYYGMYFAEFEYIGYEFKFFWLNSDGSFSDRTWCYVKYAN